VVRLARLIFLEVFRLAVEGSHPETLQRAYAILVRLETTLPSQLKKTLYQLISSSLNEGDGTYIPIISTHFFDPSNEKSIRYKCDFKTLSSESVNLKKRQTANPIHCS